MRYRLADASRVLSTRSRGNSMRCELLEKIKAAPDETVVIDLDGVLHASYSFVDEFFGKLAVDLGEGFPVLENVPAAVARTIERSLRHRGLDVEKLLASLLQTA
jgi:anti-anti-sigma regulatory factor